MVSGSNRLVKIDDEHFKDVKTGVVFHLYDDYFKITYDDEVIARSNHFTPEEQAIIWKMKAALQDPESLKRKREEYPTKVKEARERLSKLFEKPVPVEDVSPLAVVAESGTSDYKG